MTRPRDADRSGPARGPGPSPRRSALYRGTLMHARRDEHARRTFRYPVYVASIDLDELPALDRELRLFSHVRPNLFSLDDHDYATGAGGLRAGHARLLAEHGLPAPASARLVTNLKVLGYVFNPVSFFLGYNADGALTSVVAEVNNTYGGRYRYVLGPAQRIEPPPPTEPRPAPLGEPADAPPPRLAPLVEPTEPRPAPRAAGARVGFRHRRELFVSPFLHGPRLYEFWFDAPQDGETLAIGMHVDTPDGERVFVARLHGERRPLTDRALAAAALRYPLMTLQVIGLIHFEALRLRLRGVPYRRPGPDHRPLDHPSGGAAAPGASAGGRVAPLTGR